MNISFNVSEGGGARIAKLIARHSQARSQHQDEEVALRKAFAGTYDSVGQALDQYSLLSVDMADYVAKHHFDGSVGYLEGLMDYIEQIVRFNATDYPGGWGNEVNALTQQFDRLRTKADEHLLPLFTWYNLAVNRKQLGAKLDELDNAVVRAMSAEKQIQSALETVQASTSQLGIQSYAKVFADEYERYKRNSWVWLSAFCIAIVAGVWTILYYVDTCQPVKDESGKVPLLDLVNFLGGKVLLIAVFFLVVTLMLRNYFAAKHNAILNKHRACSMQSFELFVHGGSDDSTKDAIRRIAAESIFAVQKSGMLGKDQAPPNPVSVSAFSVPNK